MRTRFALAAFAALSFLGVASPAVGSAAAQSKAPIIGRWDLTFDMPGENRAGWFAVRRSGRSTLVGNVLIAVGSARPIAKVTFNDATSEFSFVVPPQWNDDEGDNTIRGTLKGDSVTGTLSFANGKSYTFKGVRAPSLTRSAPPVWGTPINLLNGKDLTGWKALHGQPNQWVVENGVLRSPKSGANLATEATFTDFKLHLEFRYPAGSNSGVYLRGRYEVQVEDTPYTDPQIDGLGALYGHLIPNQVAAKKPGEWQTFDITLVGRTLTVVLNGKTIISEQTIPGITGGALDSDEGKPGPIYLQGDHGPIEYRNIVLTPAK